MHRCFGAGRTAGVIDSQQILGRREDRHRANLGDFGAAGRHAAFLAECEQPDAARDLSSQGCWTSGRGALRLIECREILDPPIKQSRRQSIEFFLRYRANNELSRLGCYRRRQQ